MPAIADGGSLPVTYSLTNLNQYTMFYSENVPLIAAKPALVEGRYKITTEQKERLKELEEKLHIPASALIRMALDSFLPKTNNQGFTEKGIKAGYLNGNY